MEAYIGLFWTALIGGAVAIFKRQIGNSWTAFMIYKGRMFDRGECEVLAGNEHGGHEWVRIEVVKYVMSLRQNKRGVHINHLFEDGTKSHEKVPLIVWGTWRKRGLPV